MNEKAKIQKRTTYKQEAFVAAFLKTREGVLMLGSKRAGDMVWGLPHGKIELHETPFTTLKRIMWEKTGRIVDVEGLYNVAESTILQRHGISTQRITTLFRVKSARTEGKNTGIKFFPVATLKHAPLDEITQRLLGTLLK